MRECARMTMCECVQQSAENVRATAVYSSCRTNGSDTTWARNFLNHLVDDRTNSHTKILSKKIKNLIPIGFNVSVQRHDELTKLKKRPARSGLPEELPSFR